MAAWAFRIRGLIVALPLLYLVAIRSTATTSLRPEGLILVALAMALRFWSGAHIGAHSNGASASADRVVRSGPYRFNRHPLYWANAATALGLMIYGNCLHAGEFTGLAAFILGFYVFLARHEEKTLLLRFGRDYGEYQADVPAFSWRKPSGPGRRLRGFGLTAPITPLRATPSLGTPGENEARPDWPGSGRRQGRNIAYALVAVLLISFLRR